MLPTDAEFISALEENNLYRKNALCKYLLTAIENQGKEQLITDNLTIEHIMPQNKNLSPTWQTMLGDNWQEVRDRYIHTLGNLTLTGYNSELGDKPFVEKKKMLAEAHTKVVTLYEDVKTCESWNESTIKNRAQRLSSLILSLYPINEPSCQVSFSDPRYQEYSCDDPETATYKVPNYFILQGERVNCASYAEMLKQVIIRMYAADKTIIENMARNNERAVEWSQSIMFSYDESKINGSFKISGTEIYENVGFSAAHIMYIIRALLDRYDIDRADFSYSARSNKPSDKEAN